MIGGIIRDLRGSDLAIQWIGKLGSMALILAFATILTSKDPEVFKAALIIAGVAGTAVGGLIGYIGGYHAGQRAGKEELLGQPRASIIGGGKMAKIKIEPLENVQYYEVSGIPLADSKVIPNADGSALVNFEAVPGTEYKAVIIAVNKAGTSPAFTTEAWTAPVPIPPPGQPAAAFVEE